MPLNTLQTAAKVLPPDLVITSQPDVDKNYFDVTVTGLDLDTAYSFQFQWIWPDKTVGPWSAGYTLFSATESVPGAPSATVPSTSTSVIPVTLTTFPTNALRVDVKVTGGIFGTGKVAYSFLSAGTTSIAAPAGVYYVELYTITPTQINGTPTAAFTITVSDVAEIIQNPVTPTGFSAVRTLGAIEVAWDGTYTGGSAWTGFNNINLYAGTSATATAGTYQKVGTYTANKTTNKINVPVDGTYVRYDNPVYFHASAVNKSGVESEISANVVNVPLGAGKATDADINNGAVVISKLASNVLYVDNLKAGTINSSSYIRSGNKTGARIEISGATTNITTETDPITGVTSTLTYPVKPGITIYGTNGTTELLRSDYSGNLTINGNGTFTGNLAIGTSPNIFKAEPAIGIWLGGTDGTFANANFKVSTTGILTALAGTIGGWTITSTQLTSNGTNYIALNPLTPRISLVKAVADTYSAAGTITIDPIEGIKTANGNFKLSPAGNLELKGNILAGSNIAGSSITASSFTSPNGSLSISTNANPAYGDMILFSPVGGTGGGSIYSTSYQLSISGSKNNYLYLYDDGGTHLYSGATTSYGNAIHLMGNAAWPTNSSAAASNVYLDYSSPATSLALRNSIAYTSATATAVGITGNATATAGWINGDLVFVY